MQSFGCVRSDIIVINTDTVCITIDSEMNIYVAIGKDAEHAPFSAAMILVPSLLAPFSQLKIFCNTTIIREYLLFF